MDNVINEIKEYALVIDNGLEDNEYLTFVVQSIVDRFLIYTNRQQLVAQYEKDLEEYDEDNDIWEDYEYPVPDVIKRVLASVVSGIYKSLRNTEDFVVTSASDNGQSVNFGTELTNYLSSSSDAKVFSGVIELLNKFRIPTTYEDTE